MEFLKEAIEFVLHLDKHLGPIIQDYGVWTYLILFAVIFCETGLVVTPFLPGDSLLFLAGVFAGRGELSLLGLIVSLIAAAIIGDTVNYWVGHFLGTACSPPNGGSSGPSTWPTPTSSSRSTAAKPSSSPASCPSSAPWRRSSPAWGA